MPRILLRGLIILATSAIALFVASLFLDDMSISAVGVVTASLIFTGLTLLLNPLVTSLLKQYAERASILTGLIVSFLALLVTDLLSHNLDITGMGTWIAATLIVWIATVVVRMIFGILFKDRLADT